MNILVGKTFGIGNSILCVPLIKSLISLGHNVDVMIGSTKDDVGAKIVFDELFKYLQKDESNVFVNFSDKMYDVAIMSIPFDGRWENGIHYYAKKVLDCRKRPDNIERLGFDMWKKHEVEYQTESAVALGCNDIIPSTKFFCASQNKLEDTVYIGLGYKRDSGGFGVSKHFGNDNFIELLKFISSINPNLKFLSSGNDYDMIESAFPIMKEISNFKFVKTDLYNSFKLCSSCEMYIGNDTGMMHFAASENMPIFAYFLSEDLIIKNKPFYGNENIRNINFTTKNLAYIKQLFLGFYDK